jgi:hypothetical protein
MLRFLIFLGPHEIAALAAFLMTVAVWAILLFG